ncbi:MAG: 3-phosphoserine/phosphohydroxythreonine transaminase [Fibromonadaceae bacterium]|nr:3-phosphoserine/phosphohydroxythreonine transaminase [Fibromonadaceae bacterium]
MSDFKQTDAPQSGETIATISTSHGEMKIRLFPEIVGLAAENFIELARQGKYNGVPFHRVIKNFMIQGGDFENKNGTGGHAAKGEGSTIGDVYDPRLKHIAGAVSWAKTSAPNSIGSQFFIVHGKNGAHFLDHPEGGKKHEGYTVFGQLYEGFETLDSIAGVKTGGNDRPKKDVIIESIVVEGPPPKKIVYNFSAGPSTLPKQATEEAAAAIADFANTGIGIMEMSHRTKPIEGMLAETESLLRELLGIPDGYEVLFLGGGASLQFCMVPMNLLGKNSSADYTDTGVWANKALKEAKRFGNVNVVCSSKENVYNHIPKNFEQTPDATYLHVTSNNTIYGTQWKEFPKANTYLVADMSSDILSRPIDVSQFGLIYAGAQKNMGPSGVTVVIVRSDILGKLEDRKIPTMMDYRTHIPEHSMFNTPPVFPIYVMNRVLHWLKNLGGVAEMEKINIKKAGLLYDVLDNSKLFMGTAAKEDRSTMNIPFVFREEAVAADKKEEKEKEFLKAAVEAGLEQLKGHRSVGGFRASIYNAMPIEGVEKLVEFMREFEANL